MPETDPYAILAVPRAASREEIARAYRRLAKQHHPDAGAPPSVTMARINDAWRILSDPARRARWDRVHAIAVPPQWAAAPAPAVRRPIREPQAPPSRFDSGWMVVAVLAGLGVVVAALMLGVSVVTGPADDRVRFETDEIAFAYPSDWSLFPGDQTDPADHRVIAHIATFGVEPDQRCTSFERSCPLTGDAVPAGEASIVITAWTGGEPPIPEPVVSRPFGLDADAIIGGRPAAFELRSARVDGAIAWWQLSPPGFPDRWIEVRADIGGLPREQEEMLEQIQALLGTLEFS